MSRLVHALARPLSIGLGALFVLAGITKLVPPDHRYLFEMAVSAYRFLPPTAVVWAGWAIPLLEIALGVLLVLGWRTRWTGLAAVVTLSAFLSLMFTAFFTGIESYCGCFGFGEPIGRWTLTRDTLLFAVALLVTLAAWLPARRAAAAPAAGDAVPAEAVGRAP